MGRCPKPAITATSRGPKGRGALGQCPKPGAQQLVLHAQFADAPHGGGELALGRIGLALLQRVLERGFGLLAPLLQFEHRQTELTGEHRGGLAA